MCYLKDNHLKDLNFWKIISCTFNKWHIQTHAFSTSLSWYFIWTKVMQEQEFSFE